MCRIKLREILLEFLAAHPELHTNWSQFSVKIAIDRFKHITVIVQFSYHLVAAGAIAELGCLFPKVVMPQEISALLGIPEPFF